MSEGQVGNGGVTDWNTSGQSDKFWTTGRQTANGATFRWVYCNYSKIKINEQTNKQEEFDGLEAQLNRCHFTKLIKYLFTSRV